MKKQYLSFAGILAIIIGLTAISAQAQASRVHVPFDFSVNDRTLPAGDYRLDRIAGRPVVAIRPVATTGPGVFAMIIDAQASAGLEQWTFHRYGEKYFLASVDSFGYRIDLPNSRRERSLLAGSNADSPGESSLAAPPAERVAISASRQ